MNRRSYEWWIIGVIGIGSYLLGIYGFHILFEKTSIERSPIDLAFQSLKLYGMEFPDEFKSPLPPSLELARWVSPFVVLFAAFKTVLLILHSEMSVFRLKFRKNHVIISAYRIHSNNLIKELVQHKKHVVVIADRTEFKTKYSYSLKGITCIDGDLTSSAFLKTVSAHKSESIVFIDQEDDKNLEETYAVYDYLKTKGKDKEQLLLTHVANDLKMSELEELNFFKPYSAQNMKKANCHIRTFSSNERAARILFNEFSPDIFQDIKSPTDPQMHIALIGSGQLVQSVLLRFARLGHYANLKRLKITLFHEDEKMIPRLERNIKPIRKFVDLNLRYDDLDMFDSELFEKTHKENPYTAVYLLCEDDALSSNILNKLSKINIDNTLNVILSLVDPNGILNKWYKVEQLNQIKIHKFNLIEKVFTQESLFNNKLDELAKFIHGDYYNKLPEEIRSNPNRRATQYPWDELSNENRNANREQADHIAIKARAIGDTSKTLDGINKLSDEEIEILSEMEHIRWWANKALSGHVYGTVKDDSKKIHCDMVPYAELDEPTKQYDRNAIKNIPELLRKKRQQVEEY
ncbi:RyR domain-containing protein [Labilibacter marinus]|uniref:RyR domain-containing protein n=1 Tax=Labilibacter marinus TaxID=1477105 RepID=UPI00082E0C6F|nr:RyR domain-containing protein [Labilibacter marinus]